MNPSAKLASLVTSITVAIMFAAVVHVAPLFKDSVADRPSFLFVAGLISSAGLYRLLILAINWLVERNQWVRSLVLGPSYVHGTWIGWFRGHTGDIRYMVEHINQTLDGVVITGRSYTGTLKEHGYWSSQAVMVDAVKSELTFTYKFNVLTQTVPLEGINNSILERSAAHEAATGYSGFAHDLNDSTRIAVHSKKISTKFESWDVALQKAVEAFSNV